MSTHPLGQYLSARGWSQGDLERESGVAQSIISRVLSGDLQRFGPDSARKIYEATGGEVPLKALLYWPDLPLPELVERRLAPRRTAPKRAS